MKRYLFISLTYCFFFSSSYGQDYKAINNNISDALRSQGKFHELFKLSLITGLRCGTSVGITHGMWTEGPVLQYALNTGFMWRFGKAFLGNYRNGFEPKDNRTRSQFVFMFTPLLISRLSQRNYVYQEVDPFYFGTPSAIFSKFRHSLMLGTTFTISPRSYKNITTIRNRAQQDFIIGLTIKNFNFTLYDDYFPFFTERLQLGDNWDRFFTGGGFVRYRLTREVSLQFYSEVYTGINRANSFLYPDIISYRKKKDKWIRKNMANQDAGQEFFNNAWFIGKLSYTRPWQLRGNAMFYTPNIDVFAGTSASWTMFSQNWIHNMFMMDKYNGLRLHYFLHRTNVPGNLQFGGLGAFSYLANGTLIGAGSSYNFLKY